MNQHEQNVLEVKNVSASYKLLFGKRVKVLNDVNF